jgi:hypothetical protein
LAIKAGFIVTCFLLHNVIKEINLTIMRRSKKMYEVKLIKPRYANWVGPTQQRANGDNNYIIKVPKI